MTVVKLAFNVKEEARNFKMIEQLGIEPERPIVQEEQENKARANKLNEIGEQHTRIWDEILQTAKEQMTQEALQSVDLKEKERTGLNELVMSVEVLVCLTTQYEKERTMMEIYIPSTNADGSESASYIIWTKILRHRMLAHINAVPHESRIPHAARILKRLDDKKS